MEWGHVDSGTHITEEEGMNGHSLSLAGIQTGNHLKHDKMYICPGEFIECTMYTLVKYRSYFWVPMIVWVLGLCADQSLDDPHGVHFESTCNWLAQRCNLEEWEIQNLGTYTSKLRRGTADSRQELKFFNWQFSHWQWGGRVRRWGGHSSLNGFETQNLSWI